MHLGFDFVLIRSYIAGVLISDEGAANKSLMHVEPGPVWCGPGRCFQIPLDGVNARLRWAFSYLKGVLAVLVGEW